MKQARPGTQKAPRSVGIHEGNALGVPTIRSTMTPSAYKERQRKLARERKARQRERDLAEGRDPQRHAKAWREAHPDEHKRAHRLYMRHYRKQQRALEEELRQLAAQWLATQEAMKDEQS